MMKSTKKYTLKKVKDGKNTRLHTLPRNIMGRKWHLFKNTTFDKKGEKSGEILYWDNPVLKANFPKIIWYCGVEVHKKVIVVAIYGVLDGLPIYGPIIRFDNTKKGFKKFYSELGEIRPKRYLMETTGIFHFSVAWELQKKFPKAEVIVMNARRLNHLIKGTHKSDVLDAQRLAQVCRYDELIEASYVPDPQITVMRELVRQRERLIKEIVKFKNRIRKSLDLFGFSWNFDFIVKRDINLLLDFFKNKKYQNFGEFLKYRISSGEISSNLVEKKELFLWEDFNLSQDLRKLLIFEFRSLFMRTSELRLLEKIIIKRVSEVSWLKEGTSILETLPALQQMSVIILLVEIGYIERFPTEGHFLSYSGIACSGGTSGVRVRGDQDEKVTQKDRPNPHFNPVLKKTLVRAGQQIMKQSGREDLGDIYIYAARIKQKNIPYFKQAFKVAAKLGRKIYHCLKMKEAYIGYIEYGTDPKKEETNKKKMKRRKYQINSNNKKRMKTTIEDVLEYLQELGVRPKVITEIRNLEVSNELLQGVKT